jgi:hypothetical protein
MPKITNIEEMKKYLRDKNIDLQGVDLDAISDMSSLIAALGKRVITSSEFKALTPPEEEQMNADAWDKIPVKNIRDVVERLESSDTLFVQGPDGALYPRLEMSPESKDLMKYDSALFGDYSVSVITGEVLDTYDGEQKELLTKALSKSGFLLNPNNLSNFQTSLSKSLQENGLSSDQAFTLFLVSNILIIRFF